MRKRGVLGLIALFALGVGIGQSIDRSSYPDWAQGLVRKGESGKTEKPLAPSDGSDSQGSSELAADSKSAPSGDESASLVQTSAKDSGETITAEERARKAKLSDKVKDLILECTKGAKSFDVIQSRSDFGTLEDLVQKTIDVTPGDLQFRNVHVKIKGETLRLHIAPPEGGEKGRPELKVFGVDSENLPVPRPLPDSLKNLDYKAAVTEFKKQGEPLVDESSEAFKLTDNSGATVTRRNGRVRELQVFMPEGALVCGVPEKSDDPSCRCL